MKRDRLFEKPYHLVPFCTTNGSLCVGFEAQLGLVLMKPGNCPGDSGVRRARSPSRASVPLHLRDSALASDSG